MKTKNSLFRAVMTLFLLMTWGIAKADLMDSIMIPDNVVDLAVAKEKPYLMMKKDWNIFSGKIPYEMVSLEDARILWKNGYNPQKERVIMSRYGVVKAGKNVVVYDYDTGSELYKMKASYAWHDDDRDILVGYTGGDKLGAFRLSTGEKLWETKMKNKDSATWSLMATPDSTSIVYISDVAGKINLLNGENYSYPLKHKIHDNKGNALKIGAMVLGVMVGVGTGYMYTPIYGFSKFENLGSDIVADGEGKYYVADRDGLMCLDEEMKVVWRTLLPAKTGSTSRLYLRDGNLDILNTGMGIIEGNLRKVGKPFWGVFNKETGENESFTMLPDKWDDKVFGNMLSFIPDSLYYYRGGREKLLPMGHSPHAYPVMIDNTAGVGMIDKDLNIGDVWYTEGLYEKVKDEADGGMILKPWLADPMYVWVNSEGEDYKILPSDITRLYINDLGTFALRGRQLLGPSVVETLFIHRDDPANETEESFDEKNQPELSTGID